MDFWPAETYVGCEKGAEGWCSVETSPSIRFEVVSTGHLMGMVACGAEK